jgi:beta-glucosidase
VGRALLVVLLLGLLAMGLHRYRALHSSTRPTPVRDPGFFEDQGTVGRADLWLELVEKLERRMASAQPRLLFIGDSLTANWQYHGREVWDRYYGAREAMNLGISGDRTENVLWRLEKSNLEALDPEVIVIQIGINNLTEDLASETARGVLAVVDHVAGRLPRARMTVVGLFPAGQTPGRIRHEVRMTNARIAEALHGRDLHYLDFGERFLRHDGVIPQTIMWDYLHLTEEGYTIWAEAMEPLLAELLGPVEGVPGIADPAGEGG